MNFPKCKNVNLDGDECNRFLGFGNCQNCGIPYENILLCSIPNCNHTAEYKYGDYYFCGSCCVFDYSNFEKSLSKLRTVEYDLKSEYGFILNPPKRELIEKLKQIRVRVCNPVLYDVRKFSLNEFVSKENTDCKYCSGYDNFYFIRTNQSVPGSHCHYCNGKVDRTIVDIPHRSYKKKEYKYHIVYSVCSNKNFRPNGNSCPLSFLLPLGTVVDFTIKLGVKMDLRIPQIRKFFDVENLRKVANYFEKQYTTSCMGILAKDIPIFPDEWDIRLVNIHVEDEMYEFISGCILSEKFINLPLFDSQVLKLIAEYVV